MSALHFESRMLTGLDLSGEVPRFEVPPTLTFRLLGDPIVSDGTVTLAGVLANDAATEASVTVFPVGGVEPFHLELVPEQGVTRADPAGPARAPVPPPPMALIMPPHSAMEFRAVQDLAGYRYEGTPTVRIRWSFEYWLNAVVGELTVTLPPR